MCPAFSIRHYTHPVQVPVVALNDTISYHDLTMCISGRMDYFIDGTPYTLTDGDCLYIPPGSRRIRIASSSLVSYASINLFGSLEPPLATTLFHQYLSPGILQILELIRAARTTHNDRKLLLLSEYLLCDLQETYRSQQEHPVVAKIKTCILQNIYCKISVDDAISQVFLSKEYCQTLFKQETGMTIVTFINTEKVKLAKTLLTGEHRLPTIAAMLGFDDYNYFSRVFKKHTGLSPLQYRKLANTTD